MNESTALTLHMMSRTRFTEFTCEHGDLVMFDDDESPVWRVEYGQWVMRRSSELGMIELLIVGNAREELEWIMSMEQAA